MEDRFLFSIIKYKIIRVDDKPAVGTESGCVRWNHLKQWGTLNPTVYIFKQLFCVCLDFRSKRLCSFICSWLERSTCGLLWVAVCCCLSYFPSCCGNSWVEHSARTSGSVWLSCVFELLLRGCFTLFRADLILSVTLIDIQVVVQKEPQIS